MSVLVPPEQPTILDQWGRIVNGTAGPYEEGDTPSLTCRVTGGKSSKLFARYAKVTGVFNLPLQTVETFLKARQQLWTWSAVEKFLSVDTSTRQPTVPLFPKSPS